MDFSNLLNLMNLNGGGANNFAQNFMNNNANGNNLNNMFGNSMQNNGGNTQNNLSGLGSLLGGNFNMNQIMPILNLLGNFGGNNSVQKKETSPGGEVFKNNDEILRNYTRLE